jgi:hypothetical protein
LDHVGIIIRTNRKTVSVRTGDKAVLECVTAIAEKRSGMMDKLSL